MSAGDYLGLSADELVASMILGGLAGAGFGAMAVWLLDLPPILIAIFGAGGAFLVLADVRGAADTRKREVSRQLPSAIELIALCMSAGLDFSGALTQILKNAPLDDDPLIEEFGLILYHLQLGHPRTRALQVFASRVPTESVSDFVYAVVQSEAKGNPLRETLRVQASVLRTRRSVRAEELAAKASSKMVIPMTLLLASALLLIGGPMVLKMMEKRSLLMSVCLEIIRADGRIQREVLGDERTTVGSSREASIWVQDAPELEPLHILVVPRERGVWLSSVRNARTPVLLDGKPFESGAARARHRGGRRLDHVPHRGPGRRQQGQAAAQRRHPRRRRGDRPLLRDRGRRGHPAAQRRAGAGAVPRREGRLPGRARGGAAPRDGRRPSGPAPRPCATRSTRARGSARWSCTGPRRRACPAPTPAARSPSEEKRLRQQIEDDYQILRLHLERSLNEGGLEDGGRVEPAAPGAARRSPRRLPRLAAQPAALSSSSA